MRLSSLYLVVLLCGTLLFASSTAVQAGSTPSLRLTQQSNGVKLEWHNVTLSSQADGMPDWPLVEIGSVRVPAQLVALQVPDQVTVTPQIVRLRSRSWSGTLASASVPIPQTVEGQQRPALAAARPKAPPISPIVVLRESRLRGTRIVVLAVSAVFAQDGRLRAVTDLEATIPAVTLLAQNATQILASSTPFLSGVPGPTNPLAGAQTAQARVTQAGIQRITGATLAATGLDLSDTSKIHVYLGGVEVPLEVRDGGDGKLDPNDELRFYAPTPGDRWNAADTYWITISSESARRMATRPAQACTLPATDRAIDHGVWHDNTLYDSTLSGLDGDHWFATDLKTGPGLPPMMYTLTLTPTLPLIAGTTTLTVTGSGYTANQHNLQVSMGTSSVTATWPAAGQSGVGNWAEPFKLTQNTATVQLALIPGNSIDGFEPDSVEYERPVQLQFSGAGAMFATAPGTRCYRLSNTDPQRALYDLSNPSAPSIVTLAPGTTTTFQDTAAHQYLLTGPGTLSTPAVSAHAPVNLAAPLDADAVYITPAIFHDALAPLVAHRQTQGYAVGVVDVQAIYDSWSFGQVSPDAIRTFLRYAAATWHRVPKAVTLVGDGTSDPFDYTRKGANNLNLIPPYLAMVDPWLGETACETCYGQLDGDDPLSEPLPDLAVGRLPVKSVTELNQVVAKIVRYETETLDPSWRSRNIYTADNYQEANGQTDPAGDFAALSDASVAMQPAGVEVERMYYDPSPSSAGVPWREPDATTATARTIALLNNGAGLFNYTGHANQYDLAVTATSPQTQYLLTLYDPDGLTNGDRLPIVLEMTCLTSAFQTPAYSGTTIDERFLLSPGGGAIAVWGPTGLGVTDGHDQLQSGFYTTLWQGPSMQSTLGTLTMAGYRQLFTQGTCCQYTISTFALLGDPLTQARVLAADRIYMPFTQR